ncbi:MAG: FecR domain-containing protein [Chitinophagaceae bacterium]|nr:FecR domain-containing protein [Chitinophagaceae bacterium]
MTGSELKHLLEQYLDESISEQDFKKLFHSLSNGVNTSEWEQVMDDILKNEHFRGLSGNKEKQQALIHIKSIAEQQSTQIATPVKNIFTRKLARWMAAASVILISGAAIFFWSQSTNEKNTARTPVNNSSAADILPGGQKAVLKLADGTTISLDDANKGSLGKQGYSNIEKREEGQLVYHPGDIIGKDVLYNTLSTPRGGQYELVLPDNTRVWLNAASSITYPVAFNGNNRKVHITGEAYFEVAPDKSKPFIVDVNGSVSVEVLGTHFNINSYADEGLINTTLLEGKIRLANNRTTGEAVVLSPRQQAQVNKSNDNLPIAVVNNANVEEVMAWKNGYFHFTNTSLEAMMRQVERWYDVKVIFENNTPQLRFAGEIKRDLTLSQLLEGLSEMGVNVERKGRELFVKP